jgi:hypothetical protein
MLCHLKYVLPSPPPPFLFPISSTLGLLQEFINQSFDNITSIENSLRLLNKFKLILQVRFTKGFFLSLSAHIQTPHTHIHSFTTHTHSPHSHIT